MEREFRPGFRISILDVFVLICGAAASVLATQYSGLAAFIVAFVVMHFFLFCNVFRISRGAELIWSGFFLLLAGTKMRYEFLSWPGVFGISTTLTAAVLGLELRKPSYHGWAWQRVNPTLKDWWQQNSVQNSE